MENLEIIKSKADEKQVSKLEKIKNQKLYDFIAEYIRLLNPDSVFIGNGSDEDLRAIRDMAVEEKEEIRLANPNHTLHFDGYTDQARDKKNTKYLLEPGKDLGENINSIDREKGMAEVNEFMKDIMKGRTMIVRFFCLGPTNSEFSILCCQITDSPYVAHSENILYRDGYGEFVRQENTGFFRFVHSEGELENNVSKNVDKRRVYIDLDNSIVYSMNTQYGGNTIGLKKPALRLAINKASKEGWLAEHMFVMGVKGPGGRKTYFTGAYPSMCGKTSTAMLKGESIVGDDIAYLRKIDGRVYAVNVEKGMFGIIQGVNEKDDPLIWGTLHSDNEIIFSNVLMKEDGTVYWNGKNDDVPEKGINHSGEWFKGKKDENGNEIPPSHKNARFTVDLHKLPNCDEKIDDPKGCRVGGIIYGGRDSDTSVPIKEARNWDEGIVKGASLESESTAATLGQEGVRKFCPMSNIDFVAIPIGQYIENNMKFAEGLSEPPRIFASNYFIKDKEGKFLNEKTDKAVWLKWAELRSHGDVAAVETPTGLFPKYEDLRKLFSEVLGKDYSKEDYIKQFTLRVNENIEKIDRITETYRKMKSAPQKLFDILEAEKKRLVEAKEKYGDYISPEVFGGC